MLCANIVLLTIDKRHVRRAFEAYSFECIVILPMNNCQNAVANLTNELALCLYEEILYQQLNHS